jgi:hypothetical protein
MKMNNKIKIFVRNLQRCLGIEALSKLGIEKYSG